MTMVSLYRNAAAILPRHLLANAGILTLTTHTDCVGCTEPKANCTDPAFYGAVSLRLSGTLLLAKPRRVTEKKGPTGVDPRGEEGARLEGPPDLPCGDGERVTGLLFTRLAA